MQSRICGFAARFKVSSPNRFCLTSWLVLLMGGVTICLMASPVEASPKAASQTLPAGSAIWLRLDTPVSTVSSHLNDAVKARIISEVDSSSGAILIPAGAEVDGTIQKLVPSSTPTDRARLLIRFDKLAISGKTAVSFTGHISEVENAREKVLEDGTIQGVLSSELPVSHLEDAVTKIAGQGGQISKYEQKTFGKSDTSIAYAAGTDLTLVLDKPLSLDEIPPSGSFNQLSPAVASAVTQLLQDAPQRASSKDGKPGDPLNLIIVGKIAQIHNVFTKAGWSEAQKKTNKSIWSTVRAVADDQGFGAAPVSDLYLYGHAEDVAFEKMLNTFTKRHHLRLWQTAVKTSDGRELWFVAATHDIGLDVHPGVVSHAIDPDLDAERKKVGADLRVTGLVTAEQLVTRSNPLSTGLTATGGTWKTDGRLLVIDLASE